MSDKRTVRSILALYLITSGAFLLLFFGMFYQKQERLLLIEASEKLKEWRGAVVVTLRERGAKSIEAFSQEWGVKLALWHESEGVIYSNLEATPRLEGEGLHLYEGRLYLQGRFSLERGRHHPQGARRPWRGGEMILLLQGEEIGKALWRWRVGLGVAFVMALGVMGVIAYFLVRLALRPLREHIGRLDGFIKDSTHEIKTPLSVILMSLETMEEAALSPKNQKRLQNIKIAAKNLSQLYDDLVYLNFPSSSLAREGIDLQALLRERLSYFEPLMSAKNLTLTLKSSLAFLEGEKGAIARLLDNLLSNAIKYNRQGGAIRIELKAGRLEIGDEGEGMSEAEVARAFERYTRFNRDQGGLGIGLSLAREIAQAHGIHLVCESQKGVGTRFVLTWEAKA